MPINLHNDLTDLGYAFERGLLTWRNGYRYIAAVYDRGTMAELILTTAKARRMALSDMMNIRSELVPQAICQFYPADSPATWFIAFLLLDKRRVDGYQNPVGFANMLTVLDRCRDNGLGCSLDGAFWYAKPFNRYFKENPHGDFSRTGLDDLANVPSISQFIADQQRSMSDGLKYVGVSVPISNITQTISTSPSYQYAVPSNIAWAKYQLYPQPDPEPVAEADPPNKLGRLIRLED